MSKSTIQVRAAYEATKRGITSFKASDGWLWRWHWRFNIANSVRLHGEAAQVDLKIAEEQMEELRSQIVAKGYKHSNIFNMDETGLFYKAIPSRTYEINNLDKRQAGRGVKAMKAKDRLTVILCVNALGTCKISPVLIGSTKQPRCFKNNPPAIPYYHQKNAWSDAEIFSKWWNEVFLKEVHQFTSDPVALLLDGFSGHSDECTDVTGQVEIFKLPPNITSLFQPLDQGIIASFKTGYKYKLLTKLISTVPTYQSLQKMVNIYHLDMLVCSMAMLLMSVMLQS